jgi:hypothetical protein
MPAKVTGVKLDSQGMQAMLKEQFVRDELTRRAERVLASAQSGLPEFTYQIEQVTTDRAVVRVGSDDDGVLFAEAATGNLLRALDSGGGT